MQMDTLHCGLYHHHQAGSQGNGVGHGGPLTPPPTPTNDISSHGGHPQYSSSCEDQYVMQHSYAETDYHNTNYSAPHHRLHGEPEHYTTSGLSPPDSPQDTPMTSPDHSPSHLASPLHSTITEESYSGTTTGEATSRKSSRSSNKDNNRKRKSSYVYDVRLIDEQFLFLVPDLDLVKSHLMFAVREEVEVLKEKITELMERINQLEYENTVLKQYATNEALQQIQQHHNSNT